MGCCSRMQRTKAADAKARPALGSNCTFLGAGTAPAAMRRNTARKGAKLLRSTRLGVPQYSVSSVIAGRGSSARDRGRLGGKVSTIGDGRLRRIRTSRRCGGTISTRLRKTGRRSAIIRAVRRVCGPSRTDCSTHPVSPKTATPTTEMSVWAAIIKKNAMPRAAQLSGNAHDDICRSRARRCNVRNGLRDRHRLRHGDQGRNRVADLCRDVLTCAPHAEPT